MKGHVRRKTCKRDGDRPRTMCILYTDLNRFFFISNCLYFDTEMKALCNKTLTICMSSFLTYIFADVLFYSE
jgi:hypothetical protein